MLDFEKVFGRPSKTVFIGYPLVTPEEIGHDEKLDGPVIYTKTRFLPKLLVELGASKSVSEIRRNRPELVCELRPPDVVGVKWGRHLLYIVVGFDTIEERDRYLQADNERVNRVQKD